MNRGRKDAPAEALKATLNIKGNVVTMISIRNGMERKQPINAKLDDSKSPKHVTLSKDGQPVMEGIYKLEKKKLTFCFNRAGQGRPSKFESKEGSPWALMIFERTK